MSVARTFRRWSTACCAVTVFAAPAAPGRAAHAVPAPAPAAYYTAAQAAAGAQAYQTKCSRCHGVRLEGVSAPPLTGPAIRRRWPMGRLYGFVSRQMPADARGSLSPAAYGAIVAFLLRVNGHPAGRTPLTAASAAKIVQKL